MCLASVSKFASDSFEKLVLMPGIFINKRFKNDTTIVWNRL